MALFEKFSIFVDSIDISHYMRTSWKKEDFIEAVKNNTTIAGALRTLGLAPLGSNYRTVHKYCQQWNLDTSHWLGKRYSKGTKRAQSPIVPDCKLFVRDNPHCIKNVKRRVLRDNLIPYKCAMCALENEWQGNFLSLHLDHINGDNCDQRLENLRFLCPNCHSQTETYCGKKTRIKTDNYETCIDCSKSCHRLAERCKSCAVKFRYKQNPKFNWPPDEELLAMLKTSNFSALGKKLGISDNAIRKRLRSRGLT